MTYNHDDDKDSYNGMPELMSKAYESESDDEESRWTQSTPIKYSLTRTRALINRVERITLEKMGPEYIPPPPQQMKTMCAWPCTQES